MATKPHYPMFFYGTLKRGFGNHRLVAEAKKLGDATTIGKYLLMDFGGFPGMYEKPDVKEPEVTNIQGELYEITEDQLARCDCLEGHPHFYRRTPIEVRVGDQVIPCETYFYQGQVRGIPCFNGIWPRTNYKSH